MIAIELCTQSEVPGINHFLDLTPYYNLSPLLMDDGGLWVPMRISFLFHSHAQMNTSCTIVHSRYIYFAGRAVSMEINVKWQ